MDPKIVKEFARALEPKDYPCPFQSKPPKNGRLIGKVNIEEKPFFNLAAKLKEGGCEALSKSLNMIMGKRVRDRLKFSRISVEIRLDAPRLVFCNDWGVYEVPTLPEG